MQNGLRPQVFSGMFTALNAHALSQLGILHQSRNGVAERLGLVRITINGRICTNLWQSRRIGCNHGTAMPHGFQWRQSKSFVEGGVDQQACTLVQGHQFTIRDITQLMDTIGVQCAVGKDPVVTLTYDHALGRVLTHHAQCRDDRQEVFVRTRTGHGKYKRLAFQGRHQRLNPLREISLSTAHMVCAQRRDRQAIWRYCSVMNEFFGRKAGVRQNACTEISCDAKQRLVPIAKRWGEVLGDRKRLCIVKKHPLLAFEQRAGVAKVDQAIVASHEREHCLFPQVAVSVTRLFHGQSWPGVGERCGCAGGQQLKLEGPARAMPLPVLIQVMLNQSRDDFNRNTFYAGDGTRQKARIDPDDRNGFLFACSHAALEVAVGVIG